ncbi:hypothetical protein ACMXYN_17370 [Neptuniibacter sp. PT8_73]|uniref:hypothetical protein n=1 Tax=unclassified Neptuniibacter TaxID=2630693 RepID=UPI0039F67007
MAHADPLPIYEQLSDTDSVIVQANDFVFRRSCLDAYEVALKFCLAELHLPNLLDQDSMHAVERYIARHFAEFSLGTQQGLSQAPAIWQAYHSAWPQLSTSEKQAFGFTVLSLVFGETVAAEAVGYAGTSAPATLQAFDIDAMSHDVIYNGIGQTEPDGSLLIDES